MNQEEAEYIKQLHQAWEQEKIKSAQLSKHIAGSNFSQMRDRNIVEFQLGLNDILERIDHLLRGHTLKFDEENNLTWQEPKDETLKIFNEYGVQEILRILSMYLNRNTILSNYDESTINWKVYDFAIRLINLIHNKYEDMFETPSFERCKEIFFQRIEEGYHDLDEIEENIDLAYRLIEEVKHDILLDKIKLYEIIVGQLVDTVHSSYLRALGGGERESLSKIINVTQTDSGNQQLQHLPVPQQKKFSLWKPNTWVG